MEESPTASVQKRKAEDAADNNSSPGKAARAFPATATAVAAAQPKPAQEDNSPIKRLESYFPKMQTIRVKLLSSWETYKKILPVREC